MSSLIIFINILRYLTLSISLICFACHFAQCTLLSEYQQRTQIPSWFHAGHWQYLVCYVTFGLSILSALAICTHTTCCKRSHILRGDKCLGIINILPLTGTILANTFLSGQEPWTNGIIEFKVPSKGFITFCHLLDQDNDASYPLLFQRCILIDCVYVLAIMLWLSWVMLVLSTYFCSTPKKVSSMTRLPNEKVNHRSFQQNNTSRRGSKAVSGYNHPYTKKDSISFEYVHQLNNHHKYAIPIAPHLEKVELPESYDHSNTSILNSQQHNPQRLSRHYPTTTTTSDVPGSWVEYNTPHSTSPYYYQDRDGGHEENPWYPNVVKSRVI